MHNFRHGRPKLWFGLHTKKIAISLLCFQITTLAFKKNETCINVCVCVEWFDLKKFTWTQRAMTSANLDKDLAGYMPLSEGSTILANKSISWSWGVAHLTSDCSDLTLELHIYFLKKKKLLQFKKWLRVFFNWLRVCLPVEWLSTSQKLQHYDSKAINITFCSINTRQCKFRGTITKWTHCLCCWCLYKSPSY